MTRSEASKGFTLRWLAGQFGLDIARGDPDARIDGACALSPGRAHGIAFAEGKNHVDELTTTAAAAVIVPAVLVPHCRAAVLVSEQPRLAFARLTRVFERDGEPAGVHDSAIIAADAEVSSSARIGPCCVVGPGSVVGEHARIGPGSVIADNVIVGEHCRIGPRVTLEHGVRLGRRVHVEAGAVIGARGFGLVHNGSGWEAVPQLASVRVGDDVEIGANSTIDRGALDDTRIGEGAKIDNQVHIGHNCMIGAHTVIAGCTGIAGSSTIGAHCMIGGGVGIGDHVAIADGVIITAASQVPKSIDKPGVYSSTFRAMPAAGWRKRLALFRALDRIEQRLRRVERDPHTTKSEVPK